MGHRSASELPRNYNEFDIIFHDSHKGDRWIGHCIDRQRDMQNIKMESFFPLAVQYFCRSCDGFNWMPHQLWAINVMTFNDRSHAIVAFGEYGHFWGEINFDGSLGRPWGSIMGTVNLNLNWFKSLSSQFNRYTKKWIFRAPRIHWDIPTDSIPPARPWHSHINAIHNRIYNQH